MGKTQQLSSKFLRVVSVNTKFQTINKRKELLCKLMKLSKVNKIAFRDGKANLVYFPTHLTIREKKKFKSQDKNTANSNDDIRISENWKVWVLPLDLISFLKIFLVLKKQEEPLKDVRH